MRFYFNTTISPNTQKLWLTVTEREGITRKFRLFGLSIGWLFLGFIRVEKA